MMTLIVVYMVEIFSHLHFTGWKHWAVTMSAGVPIGIAHVGDLHQAVSDFRHMKPDDQYHLVTVFGRRTGVLVALFTGAFLNSYYAMVVPPYGVPSILYGCVVPVLGILVILVGTRHVVTGILKEL